MNEDLSNEKYEFEETDLLSEVQKSLLYRSFEQADNGLGKPLKEINERIIIKYNLND